jgi:hypothetical protein
MGLLLEPVELVELVLPLSSRLLRELLLIALVDISTPSSRMVFPESLCRGYLTLLTSSAGRRPVLRLFFSPARNVNPE